MGLVHVWYVVGRASIAVVCPKPALEDALLGLYDVTRDADAEGVGQTQHGGDVARLKHTRCTRMLCTCDGGCFYQGTLIRMPTAR